MKQYNSKTLTLNPEKKALLLQSVLGYLERNGFSRALKRLLSEAQIETNNWKACSLNLEDMYENYMLTCTPAETNLDTYKDQELLTDGTNKKSGDSHSSAIDQTVGNKKKSSKDSTVGLNTKKKSKRVSDSLQQTEQLSTQALKEPTADTVCELQIDESSNNQKDKKKRNSKRVSDNVEHFGLVDKKGCSTEKTGGNVGQSELLLVSVEDKSKDDNKFDSGVEGKSTDMMKKERKRKKEGSVSGTNESLQTLGNANGKVKKSTKNRKRLASEENDACLVEKLESEESKRRKIGNLEGTKICEQITQVNANAGDDKHDGTESVKENGGVTQYELQITSINQTEANGSFKKDGKKSDGQKTREMQHEGSAETLENANAKVKKSTKTRKRLASEENDACLVEKFESEESKRRKIGNLEETKICEQITQVNANAGDDKHAGTESVKENGGVTQYELQITSITQTEANGSFKKDGKKSGAQKTGGMQHEGSTEPKMLNAFQRVKIDDVKFADERLQDNSYWAKDGAEVGYGAKAQEILGQVRGRDFRHEKTKKKRGSYRGGQIDLQAHSVKFNYSDEDTE